MLLPYKAGEDLFGPIFIIGPIIELTPIICSIIGPIFYQSTHRCCCFQLLKDSGTGVLPPGTIAPHHDIPHTHSPHRHAPRAATRDTQLRLRAHRHAAVAEGDGGAQPSTCSSAPRAPTAARSPPRTRRSTRPIRLRIWPQPHPRAQPSGGRRSRARSTHVAHHAVHLLR